MVGFIGTCAGLEYGFGDIDEYADGCEYGVGGEYVDVGGYVVVCCGLGGGGNVGLITGKLIFGGVLGPFSFSIIADLQVSLYKHCLHSSSPS